MPQPELPKSQEPFQFYTEIHLPELTGLKARNLTELLEHIKTVPGSVIYYHTHHFLQQHQYLSPEPTNDFSYWVTDVLQDKKLGEKLAGINTCEFNTIRSLREKIVATIEMYLKRSKGPFAEAHEGEEFHLIKSMSFVLPTPYTVHDLREFTEVLRKITIHSIYFHMFEARIRLEKGTNDFSLWFDTALGEKELAHKVARLDPYTHTMEKLREKLIRYVEERIAKIRSQEKIAVSGPAEQKDG